MRVANIRMLKLAVMATAFGAFTCTALAHPYVLEGSAVHVADGDTLVLLSQEPIKEHKVRLSSIDAPETTHPAQQAKRVGQPHSRNARNHLAELVRGKSVVAKCFESDRYGRDVCEVLVDGNSVNRAMVQAGWAWANRANKGRYLRDKAMIALEEDARRRHAGLWTDISPIPPWEWREECWNKGACQP